jgi:hypothetical protein
MQLERISRNSVQSAPIVQFEVDELIFNCVKGV